MIKRFFQLIFGDWGMLITSALTGIVSALLFPVFMTQLNGENPILSLFLAIFIGIFTFSFYVSSAISSIILTIRSGISRKWFLFALSLIVLIADVVILIINLV